MASSNSSYGGTGGGGGGTGGYKDDSSPFFSTDNLRRCNYIFRDYMEKARSVEIKNDRNLREFLYQEMGRVKAKYGDKYDKHKLNNILITRCRDVYLRGRAGDEHGSSSRAVAGPSPPPSVDDKKIDQNMKLSRDREIYGDRPVNAPSYYDETLKEQQQQQQHTFMRSVEVLAADRANASEAKNSPGHLPGTWMKDSTIKLTDKETDAKLQNILAMRDESRRNHTARHEEEDVEEEEEVVAGGDRVPYEDEDEDEVITVGVVDEGIPHVTDDDVPEVLVEEGEEGEDEVAGKEDTSTETTWQGFSTRDPLPQPPDSISHKKSEDSRYQGEDLLNRSHAIIDTYRHVTRDVVKYLSINGFDRDWTVEPHRYSFTYKASDMPTSFRDIVYLQASTLILPMEIPGGMRETQDTNMRSRTIFQHDFSFSMPYVLLCIDGFDDVYGGTNDAVRGAFCKFMYQKHYKSLPNNRGYVVLEAMQDETKLFLPTPRASLGNLKMTIRRPNGCLINKSRDDYKVTAVNHTSANAYMIDIVLSKYFDVNEFSKGDHVVFKALVFDTSDGWRSDLSAEDYRTKREALDSLERFLNRKEGHEIVNLGVKNDFGLTNRFVVFAPGEMNQNDGEFVVDEASLEVLIDFNNSDQTTDGHLLNTSLQTTVAMKLGVRVPDLNSSTSK